MIIILYFSHVGVSQHKCFKCYNHIFISYSIKTVFSLFFVIITDHVIGLKFKDHSSLNKDSKTVKNIQ